MCVHYPRGIYDEESLPSVVRVPVIPLSPQTVLVLLSRRRSRGSGVCERVDADRRRDVVLDEGWVEVRVNDGWLRRGSF